MTVLSLLALMATGGASACNGHLVAAAQIGGPPARICVTTGATAATELHGPQGERWTVSASYVQPPGEPRAIEVRYRLKRLGSASAQKQLAPGYRDALARFSDPHMELLQPGLLQEVQRGGQVANVRADGTVEFVPYGIRLSLER